MFGVARLKVAAAGQEACLQASGDTREEIPGEFGGSVVIVERCFMHSIPSCIEYITIFFMKPKQFNSPNFEWWLFWL